MEQSRFLLLIPFVIALLIFGCVSNQGMENAQNAPNSSQIPNSSNAGKTNAELPKANASICDKFTGYEWGMDACYENVSIANGDVSTCDKINTSELKGDCYHLVAVATKNITICEKISIAQTAKNPQYSDEEATQNAKNACYYDVAMSTRDTSNCDHISVQSSKEDCYSIIAEASMDLSVCDKTTDVLYLTNCYAQIAANKHDSSICDRLNGTENKDYCVYYYAYDVYVHDLNMLNITNAQRAETVSEIVPYCDRMTAASPKNMCYGTISGLNSSSG